MRFTFRHVLVLALGLVAAQDIAGNSARVLRQVNNDKRIADRGLQDIDPKLLEVRDPKPPKPPKKTDNPNQTTSQAPKTTANVVPTISSQKPTSSRSPESSLASSKSSSIPSTTAKSISKISATSLSGSTTRTGTATGTATGSTSTATPTLLNRWCTLGGSCGATSCKAPVKQLRQRSTSISFKTRRSYPISLSKREFVDPVANWKGLKDLDDPSDLSQAVYTEFMEFGEKTSAIYIDGLIGCTAIGVFSTQGMQAYHLWENPAADKTGLITRDPVDTLYPGRRQHYVDLTLDKAKAELSKNKAKFAGGELIIMLPMKGKSYRYEVDTTYRWTDKTPGGKPSTAQFGRMDLNVPLVKQGQGIVEKIKAMAKDATGIETIKECNYTPVEKSEISGRFVMQYDPKGDGAKKLVQVWCENDTQYEGGFNVGSDQSTAGGESSNVDLDQ